MRRTPEERRAFWMLTAGVVLVATAMLAGILQLYGVIGGEDRDAAPVVPSPEPSAQEPTGPSPTPEETDAPTPGTRSPASLRLGVVGVGRTGTLLTVEVRNDSGVYLRRARVKVVARDAAGRRLSTPGAPASSCCVLLDLPAGGTYGVWASIPADAPPVGAVDVEVVAARTGRPAQAVPTVRGTAGGLVREDSRTVVTATLAAHGSVDGYVAAQAFLVDRRDRLVAVVSGRFWCFADGARRTVRMHLPQPVPDGTRVARVAARPAPATRPSVCS